jgi:serine/threonine protein kinase
MWDWSGRGTSHVDFKKDETLPLLQGRFLGYGVHGGVYETTCNGVALAWKRKFCRYRIGSKELQEIEIIRKLNHDHIIKLVGTYTHGPFLGLLLWPVAVCDLGTFLDDVNIVQANRASALPDSTQHDETSVLQRFDALGFNISAPLRIVSQEAVRRLEQSLGCLVSAIVYLHERRIRHKDLKPSNILLSCNGIWVTDFGVSSDFSTQTESVTQGGERGTPKYFAPEVAFYEPNGRSADIFSLGCIFLEMIGLCMGYSLEELTELRPAKDCSFQGNLGGIFQWFNHGRIRSRDAIDEHLLGVIRLMLNLNPVERPTASDIERDFELIGGLRGNPCSTPFRGPCCTPFADGYAVGARTLGLADAIDPSFETTLTIYIGNTYRLDKPTLHRWVFFVSPSSTNMIEKVHVFKVSI